MKKAYVENKYLIIDVKNNKIINNEDKPSHKKEKLADIIEMLMIAYDEYCSNCDDCSKNKECVMDKILNGTMNIYGNMLCEYKETEGSKEYHQRVNNMYNEIFTNEGIK